MHYPPTINYHPTPSTSIALFHGDTGNLVLSLWFVLYQWLWFSWILSNRWVWLISETGKNCCEADERNLSRSSLEDLHAPSMEWQWKTMNGREWPWMTIHNLCTILVSSPTMHHHLTPYTSITAFSWYAGHAVLSLRHRCEQSHHILSNSWVWLISV